MEFNPSSRSPQEPQLLREAAYQQCLTYIGRKVRRDDVCVEVVFNVALSAYTGNPLNLFLRGPPSIGKTWVVVNTLKLFPSQDVWFLGGLSPTALIHDYGQLEDESGEPLQPPEGSRKENPGAWEEYKRRLRNARYVVNLERKILAFLEAPSQETYERLRSILSHDAKEISYKFTDRSGRGPLRTMHVVIRGWPATIFCTDQPRYLENLATRSLTVTPTLSREKFKEALEVIADNYYVPSNPIVEDPELKALRTYIEQVKGSCVKVLLPFAKVLSQIFPAEEPKHMREFKHVLPLIATSAMAHHWFRPKVRILNFYEYTIATLEDLNRLDRVWREIQETTTSGISATSIKLYEEVLQANMPWEPTYDDIRRAYKEKFGRPISPAGLTTALKELEAVGWVEIGSHPADRRRRIVIIHEKPENVSNSFTERISGLFSREEFGKWLDSLKNIFSGKVEYTYKGEPVGEDELYKLIMKGEFSEKIFFSENKALNLEKDGNKAENLSLKNSERILEEKPAGRAEILCDHCKARPAKFWRDRGGITVWVCDSQACLRWAEGKPTRQP